MADENPRVPGSEIWRWVVLAALLLACLTAYFLYAPRVSPAIHPAQTSSAP